MWSVTRGISRYQIEMLCRVRKELSVPTLSNGCHNDVGSAKQ